jgi:hypothetical protein
MPTDAPSYAKDSTPTPDRALIEHWFTRFARGDETYEVRIPKPRKHGPRRLFGTQAGYFRGDDPSAVGRALAAITGRDAEAVYCTLNPVQDALRARADHHLLKVDSTAADTDVTIRRHFLVDVDPVRPAGIAATNAEVQSALVVRDAIMGFLAELGWPAPVYYGMSGSGGMVVYELDEQVGGDGDLLVTRCLDALAAHFDGDVVKIDTTVKNAARLTKIPGTVGAKGDHCPDLGRVWRQATADFCDDAQPVPPDRLAALAALAPVASGTNGTSTHTGSGWTPTEITAALTVQGVSYVEKCKAGYTVYALDRCLTSDAHDDGAAILHMDSGAWVYRCHHNTCAAQRWPEARVALGLQRPEPMRVEVRPTNGAAAVGSEHRNGYPAADSEASVTSGTSVPIPFFNSEWMLPSLLSPDEHEAAARDTLLDRYVAYAQQRTDAPVVFHRAAGLVMLSAIVGRRAVLRLAVGDIYAALWVLILADSSLYRKSTVLDLPRDLVGAVDSELLTPNDFTPQRFIAILAEHDGRPLLFLRDEVSGFFDGMNRLDHMVGLKETLCNVYDARPFRREKMKPKATKGEAPRTEEWRFDVREPFLAFAAATTPERFFEVARVEDLHSGYLARHGVVVPPRDHRGGSPLGDWTTTIETTRSALVAELRALHTNPLSLRLDGTALRRFNEYTAALETGAQQAPNPNLAAIVGTRCSWMAFRIAMLLACADGTQRLALPHLYRGIEEAEVWRQTALDIFSALAPSRFERQAARVVHLVEQKGAVQRRDVMRALKISKRDMDDLQATLEQRDEIRIERADNPGGGWPVFTYHAQKEKGVGDTRDTCDTRPGVTS